MDQPLVRGPPGRLPKGGAEVEAAQAHEGGQFVEADAARHHRLHVGGDALHMPVGQAAGRRDLLQRLKTGMSPHQLHAQQVEGLLQEQSRRRIVGRFRTQDGEDPRDGLVPETHPVEQVDRPAAQ